MKNIIQIKLIILLFLTSGLINITVGQSLNQISVHDPAVIKYKDKYYLFHTGNGISVSSSKDLVNWKREKSVFSAPPSWAVEKVPSFKGHIWAPDITFYKGKYYLYYSISAFGKNTSCIGVAANYTLDSSDPSYNWTDHGLVIESILGNANWNAIDPNFILDEKGNPFLSFGSFWDGIKLVKLTNDGLRTNQDLSKIPTIARRHDRFDDKISVSAGRIEMNDIEQAWCFMAGANSIFTGEHENLLVTPNPHINKDIQLLNKLGLQPKQKNNQNVDINSAG